MIKFTMHYKESKSGSINIADCKAKNETALRKYAKENNIIVLNIDRSDNVFNNGCAV